MCTLHVYNVFSEVQWHSYAYWPECIAGLATYRAVYSTSPIYLHLHYYRRQDLLWAIVKAGTFLATYVYVHIQKPLNLTYSLITFYSTLYQYILKATKSIGQWTPI